MSQYKVVVIIDTDKNLDAVQEDLNKALPYLSAYMKLDASIISIEEQES